MSALQPVGRDRVAQLVEDRESSPGSLEGRGFAVRWEEAQIHVKSDEQRLELGPGDGHQLVLQLSRSASHGERNWLSKLLRRPRPVHLWLNVRVRSRTGLPPVYFRARAPRGERLIGFPVLPGLAVSVDWDALLDFLNASLALDATVSSWDWDDAETVEVQEDPLSEVKALLEAPSMAHWELLCAWYDALSPGEARAALPRLRGELARWSDGLRHVAPDLEPIAVTRIVKRSHHHLEISRVLPLLPQDIDVQDATDLHQLAASPMASELAQLTVYNSDFRYTGDGVRAVLNAEHMRNLSVLEVHDVEIDLGALTQTRHQERLISLTLRSCRLNFASCEELVEAVDAGKLPRLEHLDLSANALGSEAIRLLVAISEWPALTRLVARNVGMDTDAAVALLDAPGLAGLDELRVGWNLGGRELLIAAGHAPLKKLDLYDRGLGVSEQGPSSAHARLFALLTCQRFHHIEHLSLASNRLNDALLDILTSRATHLNRLLELDLSDNPITNTGLLKLVQAPHLASLRRVDLSSTHITAPKGEAILETWRSERPGLEIVAPPQLPTLEELSQLSEFEIPLTPNEELLLYSPSFNNDEDVW